MAGYSRDALEGWSAKQGRILTGGGELTRLYTPERGFPFSKDELPHHHLVAGTSRSTFTQWRSEGRVSELVVGAWHRPLFVGGWEHSDDGAGGERVFNLQTRSLFIDIRLPVAAGRHFHRARSLADLSSDELTLFARRHAFAGYSVLSGDPPRCVRHHTIDWNFVGLPRARPNKWRVEVAPSGDVWKEWCWPTDDHGQHVYMERWERLPGGSGKTVALRRGAATGHDGYIVVVGDHFNYIDNRAPGIPDGKRDGSLGELVARLVRQKKRAAAEAVLGLRAGHGTVGSRWTIDAALHPWEEGTVLLRPGDVSISDDGRFTIRGEPWEVFENDFTVHEARALFLSDTPAAKL